MSEIQAAEYEDEVSKSIIELQQFRQTSSLSIQLAGDIKGTATLINLNPAINVWYVLTIAAKGGSESSYHLENPEPLSRRIFLDSRVPLGIEIEEGASRYPCSLFGDGRTAPLLQARNSQLLYAPLCDGRLYLRNPAQGHRTSLEAAAEFLRNQVWEGETVIVLIHHLLEDSHRETGELHTEDQAIANSQSRDRGILPLPAQIDMKYGDRLLTPSDLSITLESQEKSGVRPGTWYAASGHPGIYVSVIEPDLIAPAILDTEKATVNTLDHVEASALCYLVAFDLDQFDIAYALGTEHPGVGWSDHIQPSIKNPKLPGPDGIGTISPRLHWSDQSGECSQDGCHVYRRV